MVKGELGKRVFNRNRAIHPSCLLPFLIVALLVLDSFLTVAAVPEIFHITGLGVRYPAKPRQGRDERERVKEGAEPNFGGRHGRRTFRSLGEKDRIGSSIAAVRATERGGHSEIIGKGSRWSSAEKDCVKLIRGLKCGGSFHKLQPRGRAGFRALKATATTTEAVSAVGFAASSNRTDAQVLLDWRAGLNDGPKRAFATWNLTVEPNVCLWQGVGCANSSSSQPRVISIQLAGFRLAGSIPSGLSELQFLATLDLSYNHLTGSIPEDLANSSSLGTVNLSYNRLNGSLPRFGSSGNSSSLQLLNLFRNRLRGAIPSSLGQCKQLRELNLARNSFAGAIPSELGGLTSLQELRLYSNKLTRSLPASLSKCIGLVNMSLGWNQLTGPIPDEYVSLESLQALSLSSNELSGRIPPWLSSLPVLQDLHLDQNKFQGQIPSLLGNSKQLRSLNLTDNNLEGGIPGALVESSNLQELYLSANQLNGSIPDIFGSVTRLQYLYLDRNFLSGPIPSSLQNCTQLLEIVFSHNQLEGEIPDVGDFLHLEKLSLDDNKLEGPIPPSVTSCGNLTVLDLAKNGLAGGIPSDIVRLQNLTVLGLANNTLAGYLPELGGLSRLESLTLDKNLFAGTIPATLGNLSQLQYLSLGSNNFVGVIPSQLSQCSNLRSLTLDNNGLNGTIPSSLGQLRSLSVLHLQGNGLSGPIPTSFNNFTAMQDLVLSENKLTGDVSPSLLSVFSQLQANFSLANNYLEGSLPRELGLLTSVQTINLSGNNFTGTIPEEIGNCSALVRLDLAANGLTGSISSSLGRLSSLQSLNLSHNGLSGSIPSTIGSLAHLVQLDVAANNLSGGIPESLVNLNNLSFLNVSDNSLTGVVPRDGPFQNFTAASFLGNPGLCGSVLGNSCDGSTGSSGGRKSSRSLSTAAWIGIAVGGLCLVTLVAAVIAGLVLKRLASVEQTPRKRGSIIARSELFYPQLRFTVQDLRLATEDFSDINILGNGSLSKVYRGVLPELVLVAVKKFKMAKGIEITPEFIEELDELGKLRHRHLVAILGYCFDAEMNALVVQFMSNGSLENHLHRGPTCELEWAIRAKVAVGVAKALTYLHHECRIPIVHCDLKPSNVLLDAEYDAHLEDFGLSRLIFAHKLMEMTNSSVGSSLGYFPPEYSHTPTVSPKGDVYSFGILLLELITGKKPTVFKDDSTITKWCQASFPDKTLDVLDPFLIGSKDTNHKQVNLFMKVALMCAKEDGEERPTMKSVLEMLR